MATLFQRQMLAASLEATGRELQTERAVAARAGDEQRESGVRTKLDHIARLHQQILSQPVQAIDAET